jgi:hypothetical protein
LAADGKRAAAATAGLVDIVRVDRREVKMHLSSPNWDDESRAYCVAVGIMIMVSIGASVVDLRQDCAGNCTSSSNHRRFPTAIL